MCRRISCLRVLMGVHELGVKNGNLCIEKYFHHKETGNVFLYDFMWSEEHECNREYDVFDGAPRIAAAGFGCSEIYNFISRDLDLWTTGESSEFRKLER